MEGTTIDKKLIKKNVPPEVCLIADRLASVKGWAFTGSLNLYLQGVDISFNDIDIICSSEVIFDIEKCLGIYSVIPVSFQGICEIKSYYGQFNVCAYHVDLFADIENLTKVGWYRRQGWEKSIVMDCLDSFEVVPLISLEYELLIYNLIGDTTKVNGINERLTKLIR